MIDRWMLTGTVALLITGVGATEAANQSKQVRRTQAVMARIKPLHRKFGKPQPGDWILSHPEPGQTFAQYLQRDPVTPNGSRRVIYVQPLGDFTPKQREIVTLSAEYLGLYFNRPVRILDDISLAVIPAHARRKHPQWGMDQILTTYVLRDVLKPKLPRNAAALIAFTASDLWPGEGWNFLFGQASLSDRVGVWSIYRNGDPEAGADDFRRCLLRTIKTATHETGHMFSMAHCTAYECNMCGCNNLEESDRRPLYLGPECLGKLLWATGVDPKKRFHALATFCRQHGFKPETEYYHKAINTLEQ